MHNARTIVKADVFSRDIVHCGNHLKAVSKVKGLGTHITSNLSWSLQAKKGANKANSVLGFIKPTKGPKNFELLSKLYSS